MKTLASACAVLPSGDGVQGKKSAKRAAGKPQHRFAAVVALARVKVGRTPNKDTVVKAAASTVSRSEQDAPEVRKRGNRSMQDTAQAVTGFRPAGQPVDPPLASQKRSVVKTNSACMLPPNKEGRGIADGGQTEALRTKVPHRVVYPGVAAPVGSNPQAQSVLSGNPRPSATHTSLPKGPPPVKNARAEILQGRGVTTPEKVGSRPEVGAIRSVVTSVRNGAVPKSQYGEGRDTNAAPITQIQRRNTDVKEQGDFGRLSIESEHVVKDGGIGSSECKLHGQSGGRIVAKDNGVDKPCVARPSVKVPQTMPLEQRAEQAGAKATYAYKAPVAGVRSEFDRTVQRPPMEEQPRSRSRGNGGSGRQEAKTAAAQPRVKEVRSVGPKEKGSVPPEPPAPYVRQSVGTVVYPPVETQTRGAAEVKSGGTDSPVRDLGAQILDSLQASVVQGQKQVTVRLQPPELGTVLVRFREQGGELDGTLEVTETETRRRIEQALPEVVRNLQDAGIAIRRLDVTSGEPSGQELGRGWSQLGPGPGQYGSGHNRDHFFASQTMRRPPTGSYPTDSPEAPAPDRQMVAARGRIDVLL